MVNHLNYSLKALKLLQTQQKLYQQAQYYTLISSTLT